MCIDERVAWRRVRYFEDDHGRKLRAIIDLDDSSFVKLSILSHDGTKWIDLPKSQEEAPSARNSDDPLDLKSLREEAQTCRLAQAKKFALIA